MSSSDATAGSKHARQEEMKENTAENDRPVKRAATGAEGQAKEEVQGETKTEPQTEVEAPVCAVCLEGDGENDRHLLERHNCSQCKPTAWRICDVCNENLLSRVCPVCRSKYAPQVLHRWPSKADIEGASLPELPCTTMLRKLTASSNIAIFTPATGKLRFSLPRDPTLPPHRREYVQATLTVESARVEGGTFVFDNDVWEELCGEDVDEPGEGDRPSGAADLQVRRATEGMAWVNAAQREDGAVVLTQMEEPLEMLRQLASEVELIPSEGRS